VTYNPEAIAVELLRAAVAWEPEARVIANVTAHNLALFVVRHIHTCPKCGACAGVNIDCDLCGVISGLEAEIEQ
jgi:hypothetical protein